MTPPESRGSGGVIFLYGFRVARFDLLLFQSGEVFGEMSCKRGCVFVMKLAQGGMDFTPKLGERRAKGNM